MHDLLIKGATISDGTGKSFAGDVAIRGGILALMRLRAARIPRSREERS